MKKLRAFVLCALLLTLLSTSAMAEERGSYSFLELMEVMDAIDDEEAIAAGAMVWGPLKTENGNSVEMMIDMSNPASAAYMEVLTAQFGDKISFSDGTGIEVIPVVGTSPPGLTTLLTAYGPNHATSPWFWAMIVALAGLAVAFFYRACTMSRYRVMNGGTVVAALPLSTARVEAAVRKSDFAPSSGLDRRILAEIDKI